MFKCYTGMMGKSFCNKYRAIEPGHSFHSKYTNSSKGFRIYIEYFPLSNITPRFIISCTLQSKQGNISGNDGSCKGTPGNIRVLIWLKQSMHCLLYTSPSPRD